MIGNCAPFISVSGSLPASVAKLRIFAHDVAKQLANLVNVQPVSH
jgi:hypothetical protein